MTTDKLDNFKIENAPWTLHYIPNFITEEEEQHILKCVYDVPKPKWTNLKNRRLQDYGGIPHRHGMVTESIPNWLRTYMDKVSNLNVFGPNKANHVLINEYQINQGIMPHFDGSLFYPCITTISCGSHTILEFLESQNGDRTPACNVLLEPRSLIILQNDLYKRYMHFIDEKEKDVIDEHCVNLKSCSSKYSVGDELVRDTRVSLTIRNVPKVAKVNLLDILMKGKK